MSNDPDELRQQVHHKLDSSLNIDDVEQNKMLAAEAFELAQQAEAIERRTRKYISDSKIQNMIEQLYDAIDRNQRRMYQQLLLQEEKMYGLKQERVDKLHLLLYQCNERLSTVQESNRKDRLNGVSTQMGERLFHNICDVQEFLKGCLSKELANQNRIF